ncbi:hypothetical protein C0989_012528 [Termitomyces sp. Mn162]|nr:hypothetical protein C0989_012528 [Termitomyces sp. Mn162]
MANVQTTQGGFNLGGINATGQVAEMPGNWGLIDLETPQEAHTKADYMNGEDWVLVFSDEFNTDGRTFYPGDDPYWEAVDLHYWQTNDLEWYDPSGGVGGRAGYGASLEGMWPYSYDSCDVGTLPNQTYPGTQTPLAAVENGDPANNNELSYLPGQRLSACTCSGESHPGPVRANGTYVGRAAPEIDVYEALVTNQRGQVSQSAQWAPFNAQYDWFNTTDNLIIPNPDITVLNPYKGGAFQQTTSGLSFTNRDCYEGGTGCFSVYGFQYQPGSLYPFPFFVFMKLTFWHIRFDNAYITWINNNEVAWTIMQAGLAQDPLTEIGPRPIPQEPMVRLYPPHN